MKRLLFVAGLAASVAAIADTPAPRQFFVTAKVGQTYDYAFNMKMRLVDGSGDVSMSAKVKEKLIGAKGSTHRWSMSFDVLSVDDNGLLEGLGAMLHQVDKAVVQRDANAQNQTLQMSSGGQALGGGTGPDLVFPKKPISVGEVWQASVDLKGTPAVMAYRFDGYGTYAKKPAARFSGTFESNGLVQTVEPYTFYIDLADGKLLHSRGIARVTKNNRQLEVWYEIIRR